MDGENRRTSSFRKVAMLKIRCILIAFLTLFGAMLQSRALAFGWTDIDSEGDLASPAGKELGKSLGARLSSENSKVIFLELVKCTPSFANNDSDAWCSSFRIALETEIIRQNIRFLPESAKNEMRQKIAEEQLYQQNSMQVDVSKAVALGKQKAFNAFVSVYVIGDGKGNIKISASSVNIKDGVVSVSETSDVKLQQESVRPWGVWFKGLALIGGGAAGAYRAYTLANSETKKGEMSYNDYKKATTADEATSARKKSEKHDEKAATFNGVAIMGGLVALYGWYYYANNNEDRLSYKISTADNTRSKIQDNSFAWKLEPQISYDSIGLSLSNYW